MEMGIPLKGGSKARRYFVEFAFNWKKKSSLVNLSQILSTSCPSKTAKKKIFKKVSIYK